MVITPRGLFGREGKIKEKRDKAREAKTANPRAIMEGGKHHGPMGIQDGHQNRPPRLPV